MLPELRTRLRAEMSARPPLWRLYRRMRRRLLGESAPAGPVYKVLRAFAGECPDVFFVQVGSCDAAFGDPIIDFVQQFGWRGILVEPVPHVFELLRARHGRNPRLVLESVAIGSREGVVPFYSMEPLDAPPSPWYNQLGSFSRAHIEKHERFLPGLSQHIREIEVPCMPVSSLLRRHAVARVDLLHIDAEGADFEVLSSVDFDQQRPGILLFESGHLRPAERASCADFLEARGYRLLHEGRDSMAMHADAAARWPKTSVIFDAHAPAA